MTYIQDVSDDTINALFTPSAGKIYPAREAVVEFINSQKAIVEVDWRKIDRYFNIARSKLSSAIPTVKHTPEKFGVTTMSNDTARPIDDIGIRSIGSQEKVFLVHKKAPEFKQFQIE